MTSMKLETVALWISTRHCPNSACHPEQPCQRCQHQVKDIVALVNTEVSKAKANSKEGKDTV